VLPTSSPTAADSAHSVAIGAIVGSVIGGLIVIAIIIVATVFGVKKHRRNAAMVNPNDFLPEMSQERMMTFQGYNAGDIWEDEEIAAVDGRASFGPGFSSDGEEFAPAGEEAFGGGL
jgi:hypothetical protein